MLMPPTSPHIPPNAATQAKFLKAMALHQQGLLAEAESMYHEVLQDQPLHGEALHLMGMLAGQTQRGELGVQLIRQAIAILPNRAAFFSNLGNCLTSLDRNEEAAQAYRDALVLKPDFVQAMVNLGNVLRGLESFDQARQLYEEALTFEADMPAALTGLGITLSQSGRPDQAKLVLKRSLSLQFQQPNAHLALGMCHLSLGDLTASIQCYEQCLIQDASHLAAHTNLLFALSVSPDHGPHDYHHALMHYQDLLRRTRVPLPPLAALDETERGKPMLRIGLVSADLNNHPIGYFIEGLLKNIQDAHVQIHVYATGSTEDALTARVIPMCHLWRRMAKNTSQAIAEQIRSDRIDILLDLAGHTGETRVDVFAFHPAPIQISWLGYFASTGVPHMDWLMADPICLPVNEEEESLYSEKILRLPHSRLCFTPQSHAPPVSLLPALSNGFITYGSFQPLLKLHAGVLNQWAQLLHAMPDARLRLQNRGLDNIGGTENLLLRLQAAGIDTKQVDLVMPTDHAEYLKAYQHVDIVLDTFPYPGGTTTCEALWMGVPTLTVLGNSMASRQGQALMAAAKMPDWIARDATEYIHLAQMMAKDLQHLSSLRAGMRGHLIQTSLFDQRQFAQDWLEAIHSVATKIH